MITSKIIIVVQGNTIYQIFLVVKFLDGLSNIDHIAMNELYLNLAGL